jgi:hypothetical protein
MDSQNTSSQSWIRPGAIATVIACSSKDNFISLKSFGNRIVNLVVDSGYSEREGNDVNVPLVGREGNRLMR